MLLGSRQRRVLVTGGAGFVGSHLVDRLLWDSEYKVIILDDFSTGSRSNIRHLKGNPRVKVLEADVTASIVFDGPLDEIYHFACPASPVHYQIDPVKTLKTCFCGTLSMLELARRTGARFLLASTSEVYGDPLSHPQVESYWGNVNPLGPRSCYDEGKRAAESLAVNYAHQYGVQVRIARIFNTYGPRMAEDDGRVVSNFIIAALRGRPLRVYGDGLQTRSFQFITDLVDGLLRLMQSSVSGPVNIGNPQEYTVLELAQLVVSLTETSSLVEFMPALEDDPQRRRPDISRAKARLQWAPKVSVTDGLKQTIDFFKQEMGRSS